ncbi:MAG: adenylosuccinate lyase, partial [Candidatus Saccharimonadales bacterium]
GNAFYCAPMFHERSVLEAHFFGNTVTPNAVLLDPLQVGQITDAARHNITFNQAGLNATLHSDARRFKQEYTGGEVRRPPLERVDVTLDYVEELSEQLVADTRTNRFESYLGREFRATRPVERVQILLAHVYDVTWLLLP